MKRIFALCLIIGFSLAGISGVTPAATAAAAKRIMQVPRTIVISRTQTHYTLFNDYLHGWDDRMRIRYGTVDMGAYETVYKGAIYKVR